MYQFKDIHEAGEVSSVLRTTFNGRVLDDLLSSQGSLFQTLTVDGRGLLDVEAKTVDVSGRHGKYFRSHRYLERQLTVGIRLMAPDNGAFRLLYERLNAALATAEPAYLSFSDEPNRYYKALFISSDNPQELSNDQLLTLTFMCYDPFKYSSKQRLTGLGVDYQGDMPVYPKLTITLSDDGTELRLLHVQKQQYVRLVGQYRAGNKIEIDMAKRTVTQNGRDILQDLDMVNSRFFAFDKGANNLSVSVSGSVISEFREVYR